MDIVTQYFGAEEDKPKVNLIRMNKDSRVFPKNGNRRSPLFRLVSAKTDNAIKKVSWFDALRKKELTDFPKQFNPDFKRE